MQGNYCLRQSWLIFIANYYVTHKNKINFEDLIFSILNNIFIFFYWFSNKWFALLYIYNNILNFKYIFEQ